MALKLGHIQGIFFRFIEISGILEVPSLLPIALAFIILIAKNYQLSFTLGCPMSSVTMDAFT